MNKQRGALSTAFVALVVLVGFFGAVAVTGFLSYVSAYNLGNRSEAALQGQQDMAKNILAQYGQKVQESNQIPTEYKEDLTKLVTQSIQSRYGADGSKASFQVLKEANLTLEPRLYQQVQQIIEAGRGDFEQAQNQQIDMLRTYKTQLGSFWQGMWLHMAGYPKVNLGAFEIVSTNRADTAFKNHKEDGPISLRE